MGNQAVEDFSAFGEFIQNSTSNIQHFFRTFHSNQTLTFLIQVYFKILHIIAVVMFLGNIVTGLFWMRLSVKTKDVKIIAHSMNGIIKSDRLFTVPGVFLILIGGIGSAMYAHISLLRTGWIFWSLVLFSVSGIAFGWKVAPLQKKIYRFCNSPDFDWTRFKKLYVEWETWGLIALLTPFAALFMMVLKRPASTPFF